MRRVGHPRGWSLAAQFLVLELVVVVVLLGAGFAAAYVQAADATEDQAAQETLAVASTVAEMPTVVEALDDPRPSTTLQPLAERIRARTGTDFVVVMSPTGIRYSHPDPAEIGRHFIGTIAPAAAGRVVTETYTGTLGPSVRTVVPVRSGGEVVALVSVGITERHIGEVLASRLPWMVAVAAAALLLGTAGTWLVTRRVRRQTRGLAPEQLRAMYDYHDAVLHSVREGLLVVDADGRLHLVNDEARRLLGVDADDVGRPVGELGLPADLAEALLSGEARADELYLTASRVLVLNQTRTRWAGRDLGTVATLRDRTELESLTGELDSARNLADALRSQQHEALNRMHTVVSLIELGHTDRAMAFAVEELQLAQRLTDRLVSSVSEPALAALLLGKAAQAAELGLVLEVDEDSNLPAGLLPPRELVTIVGNLVDNAFDATLARTGGDERPRTVQVDVDADATRVRIVVADSGDGPPPDVAAMFVRGWSTKSGDGGRGLGLPLVQQAVRRLHGTIDVSADRGAVFDVVLPLGRARQRGEAEDAAGARG
ncbi:MAG: sensor histidine kinase [Actinomycetota bacterium]|nr:sensor histidine kinase [Actinomycetota bacterium]